MRFVVTGCPGSGTKYIAQLLTHCGVATGHEQAFKHGWPDGRLRIGRHEQARGESSWYAVPFLPMLDMVTVHQTRHPLKAIRTLVGMIHWRENMWHQPLFQELVPAVFDYTDNPVLWSARFWLDWNHRAEACAYRWDVGSVTPDEIDVVLRNADINNVAVDTIRQQLHRIPKTGGGRNYGYDLTYEDLKPMTAEVAERAAEYGY